MPIGARSLSDKSDELLDFFCIYDFRNQVEDERIDDGVNPFIPLDGRVYNTVFFKHRQVLANDGLAFPEAGPEVGHTGFSLVVNKAEKLKPDRVAADLEFPGYFFDHIIGTYFFVAHSGTIIT